MFNSGFPPPWMAYTFAKNNTVNKSYLLVVALPLSFLVGCAAIDEEQDNAIHQLPTVNERRLKLVAGKIESVGCILDERAILEAKDGQPITFKHPKDPRGDIIVTFNHIVLPKGNWILFEAKNSIDGGKSEDPPEASPTQMEAVSAVISGIRMNFASTPQKHPAPNVAFSVFIDSPGRLVECIWRP